MLLNYTDLMLLYRIHNRLGLSGRCTSKDNAVGPLSQRERGLIGGILQSFVDVHDLY
ncbi:hypothetical protein PS684_04302 [Pseudomonas fluorescens]|nr:hypothetical protein PS684_04302 [Pseudomonas fluorescens]